MPRPSELSRTLVRETVRELLATRSVTHCRLSVLELGYSARTIQERDTITSAVEVFPLIEVEPVDLWCAGATQRLLAGAALRRRKMPDVVITAVAQRLGLTVLHYDRDFELISDLTGQPHEWVVRRGDID